MALASSSGDLESLIDYIKATRGFDFTGYKRPSLLRRFEKRMQMVRAGSFESYRSYLDEHPDEFTELFNTILINVTAFFRDPAAWEYLRKEIVPRIVEDAETRDAIRIWSTGCASGEEAYSLAICFAEALPAAEFGARVKIYATDIDEEALSDGRHGIYTAPKLENVTSSVFDFLATLGIFSLAAGGLWGSRTGSAGAAFAVIFFAAYFVLYAWYDKIINDTRFILSIFLPFVFAGALFVLRLGRDRMVSMAGRGTRGRTRGPCYADWCHDRLTGKAE